MNPRTPKSEGKIAKTWRTLRVVEGAKSGTRPYKLGAFVDGVGWVEHEYGRVWQRDNGQLIAAPDIHQIELIQSLAAELAEPYEVTYVLLVPRGEEEDEGRFDLAEPLYRDDLFTLLYHYRELFEDDGRHHLVIRSGDASIRFDQHNVIYLQGPIDAYVRVLSEAGLREGAVVFPSPHSHHYHEELDSLLDDMLETYNWRWYPGT